MVRAIVFLALLFSMGCGPCGAWEYSVEQFSRSDDNMQEKVNDLGIQGWEYAGPLTNNGLNAKVVLFKRCKK